MSAKPSSGRADLPVERRDAPRFQARIPVGYSGARLEGQGIISNLSNSGAALSEITTPVPNGLKLNLEFGALSGLPSISLWAEVVRQTEDGFVLRFLETDTENWQLLGSLLELIAERAKS